MQYRDLKTYFIDEPVPGGNKYPGKSTISTTLHPKFLMVMQVFLPGLSEEITAQLQTSPIEIRFIMYHRCYFIFLHIADAGITVNAPLSFLQGNRIDVENWLVQDNKNVFLVFVDSVTGLVKGTRTIKINNSLIKLIKNFARSHLRLKITQSAYLKQCNETMRIYTLEKMINNSFHYKKGGINRKNQPPSK